MKSDFELNVSDELITYYAKRHFNPGIAELLFWRRLMNIKNTDRHIDIGNTYTITEKIIVADEYHEVAVFIIKNGNGEAEACLVYRRKDGKVSETLLRAKITFKYVNDPYSAYDGMKKGAVVNLLIGNADELMNPSNDEKKLVSAAYDTVMSSKDYGVPCIHF